MKTNQPARWISRLAGAFAVLICMGWSGETLAGGPDVDQGVALQAMSPLEDWVFQTTWEWLDHENPVGEDRDTVIELSAPKGDMFRLGGYNVPYGQFIVQTGAPEEIFDAYTFGFRNDTFGPWELPPNTPMKLTLHYKAATETLDFWRDDELMAADFRGNLFGPCGPDGIAFGVRTPEQCEASPPHALSKVFMANTEDDELGRKDETPDAIDKFDNIIVGLLDPATAAGAAAGTTAPSALLDDDHPGLNLPIEPGEPVDVNLVKDWGAINRIGGTWDTSDGTLTSTTLFESFHILTTMKGGGERSTIFEFVDENDNVVFFRGDMNRDGSLDNLDITGFIAAVSIGGSVTDPENLAQFEAAVPGGDFKAGDQDRSNTVDNLDITPFIQGLTLAGQAAGASVPEPATALLMTGGVLVMMRRRRKSE